MIREAKNDGTTDGLFVIVELTTRPHSYDVRDMQEKGWINGSDGREPRNNNPLKQVDVKRERKRDGERDRLRRGGTDERG